MESELVGVVGFGVLLLFMFLGIPVAICMIVVGFAGLAILSGINFALSTAELRAVSTISNYTLAIVPVFLLMGELADISGMMRDAYRSTNTWLGNIRGGLAMASIFGAGAFSCVSGSSMACAAIMGRVALPQLLEYKYDPALATGALCAGGTLGNLVPPGILPVFYALMAQVSLGKLFTACLFPGALLSFMYMGQIYIACKLKPSLAPGRHSSTWKEKLYATKGVAALVIVFIIVMGGIFFGVYTPNEAASIGTVFIFLYALIRKTLNGQTLVQAFKNTLITSGMAFAIVIGANIFSVFIALSQVPQALATWLMAMNLSVLGVIIFTMVVYFILGIPMSPLTMILLTLPIFLPVLKAFDIDLIWFGVLVIIQMELANLSPPVGFNLFVIAAIAKPMGISIGTVFRGALPFCVTMLVFNAILIAFPQIALFLVSQMWAK